MPELLGPEVAAAREVGRARTHRNPTPPRPLPEGVVDNGQRYPQSVRAQALTLSQIGMNSTQISRCLNIPDDTIRYWIRFAKARGWEGSETPFGDRRRILTIFIEAAHSPGRPKEMTQEDEQRILQAISKDRSGREKSSEVLGYEAGWAPATILRLLNKHGYSNVKPTRKPGLNQDQRARRLAFCLKHASWTLDDWKNVIWSDETSVILGNRRGTVRL